MYYKKRCATYVASLEVIDYEHQARAMVGDNESERKVRLIMAKESLNELSVSITPIKRRREQHQEDLPCVQEGIDAYKVWLSELLVENPKTGDDITNDVRTSTENGENDSSQARKNWLSHARRPNNEAGNGHCTGGQKKGRGPLKGHSIAFKRIKWDFGNIPEAQVDKKILGIARSRYAGWRSTLSATYMAYESDAERAKHKPVDVDSVEWHYLMKYFATEKFQWNPETGEEPNDIELWMITHSKNGKWSNLAAQDVYENAVLNLHSKKVELNRDNLTHEEQNILFQSSYREIIPCKRTTIHGHGYMTKYPTRAELMDAQIKQSRATAAEQERNKQLEGEVQRLREEHADQTAQTDRKVEEATQKIQKEEAIKREEMRKQIKEDMAAFFALQTQASTLQITNRLLCTTQTSK
ncbi:hypothetical protein U9M48_036327 [Paspalum notatum var. saurae]|uniref:Uncharacterized protein n=1 Tax=Paspalum notatum var. saurae TaxID=547442 RepID=A0AAQ3UD85_PASNO